MASLASAHRRAERHNRLASRGGCRRCPPVRVFEARARVSATRSVTIALMTRRIVSCRNRGGGTSRLARRASAKRLAYDGQMSDVVEREQFGAQPVVQVVAVVGDVVR